MNKTGQPSSCCWLAIATALDAQILQEVELKSFLKKSHPGLTPSRLRLSTFPYRWTLPNHGVWVKAEPDLLRQAIANLLSNACKYTPAGGWVKVSLSQGARQRLD